MKLNIRKFKTVCFIPGVTHGWQGVHICKSKG